MKICALLLVCVAQDTRRVPLEYRFRKGEELRYRHELQIKASTGEELKFSVVLRYVVSKLVNDSRYAAVMRVAVEKIEADKTYEPKDLAFTLEAGFHG